MGAHGDADERHAHEKGEPKPGSFRLDGAVDKQDRADDSVEKTPNDIDGGGGKAFARRFGEGGREFIAGDAVDEMRDGVGEEEAGEKRA